MSVTLFKGNDRYSTISSKLSFPAFIMRMAIFLRYSSCPSRRCCFNSIINVMYSNFVSSCCFTRSTFEATSLMKLLSAVLPLDLSVVARMLLRFFYAALVRRYSTGLSQPSVCFRCSSADKISAAVDAFLRCR